MSLSRPAIAADVNVLIIGSEHDSTEDIYIDGGSKPFSATGIKTQLERILGGAGLGTVNVQYEDRYRYEIGATGRVQNACYNLANWLYCPLPAGEPQARWANLRGEAGTDWDYVILIGDPFTMEYLPGMYTHGVAEIGEEVAKGGGETILLMPWPGETSVRNVNHYKEVVYRTGRSGGYKVAPAALAWQACGSPKGSTHPTNDGAYIAAASIFSRVWNRSASTSSYTYNTTMADTVHTTVTNNVGKPQYTGKFEFQSPFRFYNDRDRVVNIERSYNSSTPQQYFDNTVNAVYRAGAWETDKENLQGGISYMIGRPTPGRYFGSGSNYDAINMASALPYLGRDIYNAEDLITESNDARVTPWRFITAHMWKADPTVVTTVDNQHAYGPLVVGSGSYEYTIISGRCPVDYPAPEPMTHHWLGQMTGYEMAWRVGTLQCRAPGFKVLTTSSTVGFATPERVTVQFLLPPQSNVTVNLSATIPGIKLSRSTMTFTPENYDQPQELTMLAEAGQVPGTPFLLEVRTISDDEIYNDLLDSWPYKVNTPAVPDDKRLTAFSGVLSTINLTKHDVDHDPAAGRLVEPPLHGTVEIDGLVASYQSTAGYVGPDRFTFVVNDGSDDSLPATAIINVIPKTPYGRNLLINGSAELFPFADYNWVTHSGSWTQDPSAFDGTFAFDLPDIDSNKSSVKMYQDIDLSIFAERIRYGDQSFVISGLAWSGYDEASVAVQWRNSAGVVISTYDTGKLGVNGKWGFLYKTMTPPPDAVSVRYWLQGTGHDLAFDAMSLAAVKPVNFGPVAKDETFTVTAGVPNTLSLSATDFDKDDLIYEIVDAPVHGSVTVVGSGPEFTYETFGAYSGGDSFTFRVYDGTIYSGLATVTLNAVNNQAPTIVLKTPRADTGLSAVTALLGVYIETTVQDDGKPNALTYEWSLVSGSPVTFTNPDRPDTGVWGGDSVVRLTVSDGELSATQDVIVRTGHYSYEDGIVNIGPYNQNNQTANTGIVGRPIRLLNAYMSEFDEIPSGGKVFPLWKHASGPGRAIFEDATAVETTVVFDTVGTHTLLFITDDGAIKSYTATTFTITADPSNHQPTAADQAVAVNQYSADNAITLAGADSDGDALTFHIVDQPAHGKLSGTAPNVMYTPAPGYVGADSFTFRSWDGKAYSKLGTVSITVNKITLDVEAGPDQTATLRIDPVTTSPIAGAFYEWDAARDTAGDTNWLSTGVNKTAVWTFDNGNLSPQTVSDVRFAGLTHAYEFPAAKDAANALFGKSGQGNGQPATFEFVLDVDDSTNGSIFETGDGTGTGIQLDVVDGFLRGTAVANQMSIMTTYRLSPEDMGRFIHVVFVVDQNAEEISLYVDGDLKDSKKWVAIGWGSGDCALGSANKVPSSGSTSDFVGKLAIFRYYKGKAFTTDNVLTNFRALAGASASLTLDGTVSATPDHTKWTLVSGPAGVLFADAASIDTTATFMVPGRYRLRLSASDGTHPDVSDELQVWVSELNGNRPPVARAGGDRTIFDTDGNGSVAVVLDGSASSDNDGSIVSYLWTEGITQLSTSATTTVPLGMGNHTIRLTVTDNNGATSTDTISITVSLEPPTVDAGLDQTVTLTDHTGDGLPVAGAYFEWDAAQDTPGDNIWASTTSNTFNWVFGSGGLDPVSVADGRFNRITHAYMFPAAKDATSSSWVNYGKNQPATFEFVIDVDAEDGSIFETGSMDIGMQIDIVNGVLRGTVEDPAGARVSYPLSRDDKERYIHVVFVADNANNVVQLYVDGDLKDSKPWTSGDIWVGSNGSSLGGVNGTSPKGGTRSDFVGKMALFRYYRNKVFTTADVSRNFHALSTYPSATTNLDATVTSPASQLRTTWSVVSTIPANRPVFFGNSDAVDTTATFLYRGTYTLRLTADDDLSAVYDDVVITVNEVTGNNTVSYNANGATGGTAPANQTKTAGVNLTLATNSGSLVKSGYTFSGWNTAANGSGTDYAAGATYSTDASLTLYAKWTNNTQPPAAYTAWSGSGFANPFSDTGLGSNPDGDSRSNLMEFAFGTDPTRMDMGPLAIDGSRHGDPVLMEDGDGGFDLYFMRRKDGSLNYTACFSSDLVAFQDNKATNPPVVVANSTTNAAYEVVKVPFPDALDNGKPAQFGRLRLEVTP